MQYMVGDAKKCEMSYIHNSFSWPYLPKELQEGGFMEKIGLNGALKERILRARDGRRGQHTRLRKLKL